MAKINKIELWQFVPEQGSIWLDEFSLDLTFSLEELEATGEYVAEREVTDLPDNLIYDSCDLVGDVLRLFYDDNTK